jgi:glutamine synthetase
MHACRGASKIPPSPVHCPAPAPAPDPAVQPGTPWACCPRSALKRCLAALKERHGLTLKAGFELEFMLLKEVGPDASHRLEGTNWAPVDNAIYSSTSGLDAHCEGAGAALAAGSMRAW